MDFKDILGGVLAIGAAAAAISVAGRVATMYEEEFDMNHKTSWNPSQLEQECFVEWCNKHGLEIFKETSFLGVRLRCGYTTVIR